MSFFRTTRKGTTYREPTGNRAVVAIVVATVVVAAIACICVTIVNVARVQSPAPPVVVPESPPSR